MADHLQDLLSEILRRGDGATKELIRATTEYLHARLPKETKVSAQKAPERTLAVGERVPAALSRRARSGVRKYGLRQRDTDD